ncbi:MAG: D-alanine--D-alanine ligase [Planctomycetota bacterium]|jgi:D-alanine-D-alanine ligase|nr:D-alanine--D-alanine ligase [Planctomycetota bacterium]MDP7250724.1 D-alanine--D-alanine ligase [Planctomycetota bacterium]
MNADTHVVVMMGGFSSEREISLKTGQGVVAALESKGFLVSRFDVRDGGLTGFDPAGVDAVFIALHGEFGEDGGVQDRLEHFGLPYTGSDPEASRLAMDKVMAKERFEEAGLKTPPGVVVDCLADMPDSLLDVSRLGFPLVVKPVSEGSSIGVNLARHHAELSDAIKEAAQFQQGILIEKFIPGRELTVSILGDEPTCIIEIHSPMFLFDFESKYDGSSKYLVPAPIEPKHASRIQQAALTAHQSLGCRDMSRVDIRLKPDDPEPFILEVNTIPGMTAMSLLPMAAAHDGLSYADLCEQMIHRCLARAEVREPALV